MIFGVLFILFGIGMLVVILRPDRGRKGGGAGFVGGDFSAGGFQQPYQDAVPPSSSHFDPGGLETSSSWDGGSSFLSGGFDGGGMSDGGGTAPGGDGCG